MTTLKKRYELFLERASDTSYDKDSRAKAVEGLFFMLLVLCFIVGIAVLVAYVLLVINLGFWFFVGSIVFIFVAVFVALLLHGTSEAPEEPT